MQINSKRNLSIDLLRIIAMLMIVIWHSTNHGGLENITKGFDPYNIGIHLIKSFTCVAVDVYVLISGYFLCTQKFRLSRIMKLWLQVFFYSFLILALCISLDIVSINSKDILSSLLPLSYRINWFVSTYVGLYLLSPVINKLIISLDKRQHFYIVVLLLVCTSVWHDFLPMSFSLDIYDGKRLSWFIVLYMVAAYIRKYVSVEELSPAKMFKFYIASCLLQFLVWGIIITIGSVFSLSDPIVDYASKYYYSYGSCFTFASALFLFLSFLSIKKNYEKVFSSAILTLAPLTFGVYLIHDNYLLYGLIWGKMLTYREWSIELVLYAILTCLFIFVICMLIDYIRHRLFELIYRTTFWERFSARVDKLPHLLMSYFNF